MRSRTYVVGRFLIAAAVARCGSPCDQGCDPVEIAFTHLLNPTEFLVSVSASEIHVMLLTSQSRVFTWGLNTYEQVNESPCHA